jgi:hypothetical protein
MNVHIRKCMSVVVMDYLNPSDFEVMSTRKININCKRCFQIFGS